MSRYGAARMLINNEHSDNIQRHDSVKPVCCWFLCILIDPSLLFNMTAAPRATIRPHLYYLLFCAQYDSTVRFFICQSPLPTPPVLRPSARSSSLRLSCLYMAEEILMSVRKQTWLSESKGDFQKSKHCNLLLVLCILMNANWGRSGLLVVMYRRARALRVDLLLMWRTVCGWALWCRCYSQTPL